MKIIPKDDTRCRECIWAKYKSAKCILSSGYICKLNPFQSIPMGLGGKHVDRKMNMEIEKE